MIVLETNRLLLRKMNLNDTEALLGIFADPVAMRFYPRTKTRREAADWIRRNIDHERKYGFGLWVVFFKDTRAFAGQCGLHTHLATGKKEVEVGYLFLRKYWDQGLATEAAAACRDYGIQTFGLKRLASLIVAENRASRRVAEKIGLTLEKEVYKWDRRMSLHSLDV